jgi:hypothetical protein
MALFGLACTGCVFLTVIVVMLFFYVRAVFHEIYRHQSDPALIHHLTKRLPQTGAMGAPEIKENFNLMNASPLCGDQIDMSYPAGQTVSVNPLSKECLLNKYITICSDHKRQKAKEQGKPYPPIENVYDYLPFLQEERVQELQAAQYDRNAHKEWKNQCSNLNFHSCIVEPRCGWLSDRGGHNGRCLPGTPIGPLNPRDQPTPEEGTHRNTQMDQWVYSHPNPWEVTY